MFDFWDGGSSIWCLIFGSSFDFETWTQNHLVSCSFHLPTCQISIHFRLLSIPNFSLLCSSVAETIHFTSQILGRTIDLRSLITQRMNKLFRENIDFLLERFEYGDLCGVVVRFFYLYVQIISHVFNYIFLSNLHVYSGQSPFGTLPHLSSQIRNYNNYWIFWSLHISQFQDFLNWILTLLWLVKCKRTFHWFLIRVASLLRFGPVLPCFILMCNMT